MNDRATGFGRPRVTVLNSPLIGQEYVLAGPFAAIGRNAECEVQLDLVSISRRHAIIEEVGGRFIVRDLGSRNGIKVGGRAVAQAELHDGDVIGIGEVDLRFEQGAPHAAAPEPSVAQPPARALTAADIMTAAPMSRQGEREAIPPAEDAGPSRRDPRLIIAILLGLALAIAVGAWVVLSANAGTSGGNRKLAPVLVEANGSRIVSVPTSYGDFHSGNIEIDETSVVEASRYDKGFLLITGKSGGNATVSVTTTTGKTVDCQVLVRGRLPDPVEELTFGPYNEAERLSMARRFVSQAEYLEREQPYLALQKYEEASAVMKPLPSTAKGELYMKAKRRAEALRKIIEERWQKLQQEIRIAAGNNDLVRVENIVADAVELIPNENDPRHQLAVATRAEVLRIVLQDKNR